MEETFEKAWVPAGALKTVEAMSEKGVSVQTLPPIQYDVLLGYRDLSSILDNICLDVLRFAPNIFDEGALRNTTPPRLKAFLYVVAMDHFKKSGTLVSTGGQMFPDTTDVLVPTPLLAWLQYVNNYSDGLCRGRVRYQTPATLAVVGRTVINPGVPTETDLSITEISNCLIPTFLMNNTYQEYVYAGATGIADANNVIGNWNTYSDTISDLLSAAGYPTLPMWEKPPPPPDASFFSYYSDGQQTTTVSAPYLSRFANVFEKWDEEIAALFYTKSTYTLDVNGPGVGTRPGPLPNEYPVRAEGVTFMDTFDMRKAVFILVIRNMVYEPGMDIAQTKNFQGAKLKTLVPAIRKISFQQFHNSVARATLQLFQQSGSYDSTISFVMQNVMNHVLMRKYQLVSCGNENRLDFAGSVLPQSWDKVAVLAPIAQIINEFGVVVKYGQLILPQTSDWSNGWWYPWSAQLFSDEPMAQYLSNPSNSVYTWQSQTLNATWVTNYTALTYYNKFSWNALTRGVLTLSRAISTGLGNPNRGDLLYNISGKPWGSETMLVCLDPGSTGARSVTVENNYVLNCISWEAMYAVSPIVGPNIAMALLSGFSASYSNTSSKTSKYGKIIADKGVDYAIERYVTETMTPGGTFWDVMAKAYDRRHKSSDDTGLVSANEDPDACLWDAVKVVAGTIAGVLQPASENIAELGCKAIPVVGEFAAPICKRTAAALMSYAADLATTSTAREAAMSPKDKFREIALATRRVEAEPMGEIGTQHPDAKYAGALAKATAAGKKEPDPAVLKKKLQKKKLKVQLAEAQAKAAKAKAKNAKTKAKSGASKKKKAM